MVDKYPELIFRVPFVKSIFPDAKFIFLVRNGWDTCSSIKKWSERLGKSSNHETHNWWGRDNRKWHLIVNQLLKNNPSLQELSKHIDETTDHLNMAMVEWIVTMQEGLKVKHQYPKDIHTIRFEDMTNNPQQSLRILLDFCNLPPDETMLKYASATVSPVKPHTQSTLHPLITEQLTKTMRDLGY